MGIPGPINFDRADTPVVAPFLDEDSAEHAALERIVGERLASDSAELLRSGTEISIADASTPWRP